MKYRTPKWMILAGWTAAIVMALGISAPVSADDEPVKQIRSTIDKVYELLDENREVYEEDPTKLEDVIRDVLLPTIDHIYTARLVLGRQGRELEREQVEAFSDALGDLLLTRYSEGLLYFETRDQVEVLPLAGENTERMTRVRTRLRLDSGSRVPIDYVMRKTDDSWKVFDVVIEGISYVTTFRNQIGDEIRQDGFERVLERMQRGELEIEVEEHGDD